MRYENSKTSINLFDPLPSFCNIAYILKKGRSNADLTLILSDLSQLCQATTINQLTIKEALKMGYKDFEDAVQYQSALQVGNLTHFITRNTSDFQQATLPIMIPNQYWSI
jgi:hypothetical protein